MKSWSNYYAVNGRIVLFKIGSKYYMLFCVPIIRDWMPTKAVIYAYTPHLAAPNFEYHSLYR